MTNELKAISKTDDELRVANYIVLFGGRDLEGIANENKNTDGTTGEYFTKATALDSAYTETGRLLVDWEHGHAPDGEPQRDDVLGYVDWSTKTIDDKGVWVERVLNRRNAYMRYLEQLVEAGMVGNSSEAVPGKAAKGEDGEIKVWPLKRDTLTVTPMEPRMMKENVLQAYKALGLFTEDEQPEAEPEASDGGDAVKSEPTNENEPIKTTMEDEMAENEAITVNLEDLKAMTAEAAQSGAAEALKAYVPQTPVDKSGYVINDVHDNKEDAPWKSLGEFLLTVASNEADPRLRPLKSKEPADEGAYNFTAVAGAKRVGSLHEAQQKAISGLSETVPADGGLLVGTDRQSSIMERVYSTGELLQRIPMMPISGNSNGTSIPGVDETSRADGSRSGGILSYWEGEGQKPTGSKPTFKNVNLKLNKLMALVYATDELLMDASALESWIMSKLPDELRFKAEDAVLNGTGAGMPLGMLESPALVSVTKEKGQDADTLLAENIINMYKRRAGSAGNYIWLHNQNAEAQLFQMALSVGTGGQLVYMPPGGLSASPYAQILGRPDIATEYNPALGDVGDLMFINPREYQMIEKGGIQGASSIHVRFEYGEKVFRFIWRVDGRPLWHSAVAPFKGSSTDDTISPYIALAERA